MKKNSKKTEAENANLCQNCDNCCRYIAMEIDKPSTKAEKENIIWFLLHENVSVYIGHDNHWYVEFQTPCKALVKSNCSIYKYRPTMCRDYDQENCTNYNKEPAEKILFTTPEQFNKYINLKKKK